VDRWEVERAIRTSELPPLARLVALSLLTRADAATAIVPVRVQLRGGAAAGLGVAGRLPGPSGRWGGGIR
jgi:hypothetical protein